MTGKFCKIWNAKLKRAVLSRSYKELMFKGSRKLNIENETIKAFLEDGTEIDDEEVFQALPAGVIIYLLTDEDQKPWDKVSHSNEIDSFQYSLQSTSVFEPQTGQQAATDWSTSLIIPTSLFSSSLKKDVESGDLSWATKSELLGVICQEIEKYTFFPTVSQRDAVARQLVAQFPNLKYNIGEGHEGWSHKIYDRMKNNMKKANLLPSKRKVDSEKSLLKHSSRLKYPRTLPKALEKGNKIVEEAKEMMSLEMKNRPSERDLEAIEIGLDSSFSDRKRLIESNIPLDDLQKEYPALFTVFGIEYDFNTVHKIDLQRTVFMSLHACSSAILKYAEKKKKNNLLKTLKGIDNNVNNKLVLATIVIPEILGEDPELLYKKYPAGFELNQLKGTPITPHICVIGDPFLSSEIYIVAENKILVECCDFLDGISALIGLYFVANIEYPKQAMATYKFFQSYILKLPCKHLPGKLITFCKALP